MNTIESLRCRCAAWMLPLLTACAQVPALPELSTLVLAPPGAGTPRSTATLPSVTTPSATGTAPTTDLGPADGPPVPMAPPFTLKPDEVKAMLVRSDPKACSATSDASPSEIAATYAKVTLLFGARLAQARLTSEAELQNTLNQFKPYMRELSRNTLWLPVEAERMIGDQIYAYNKLEPYTPPARQRALLDKTLKPMFEQLRRFAAEDLKSPLKFEVRVVRLDQQRTPSVIAGGLVIIPSGMFGALAGVKDPEAVLAFMLAHEFSHALRRHTTKMVQMSLVDSMMLAKEFKLIANTTRSGMTTLNNPAQLFSFSQGNLQSLVDQTCKSRNWFTQLEQNQEYEADVCGALLLKKLGEGAPRRYRAVDGYSAYLSAGLAAAPAEAQAGSCDIKASHPDPAQRMQNLTAYER
jgi:Peptidase family M48